MKPERSDPSVSGKGTFTTLVCDLIHASHGPTPVAATRTSTSPGPGVGRGTSSTTITLGGPNSCIRAAFIHGKVNTRTSSFLLDSCSQSQSIAIYTCD